MGQGQPRITELKDITLTGVLTKGIELGRGAYGHVFKVKYRDRNRNETFAAKEIHPLLLQGASQEEKEVIKNKFIKEILYCSEICHPNIVKFVGVYYSKESGLSGIPNMVMELMEDSLASFVEKNKSKIATDTKMSILFDVSCGLTYLHTHIPPVIHRDLSPNNVMLTSKLVAKIGDLGVAKVIDVGRRGTKSTLTMAPGCQDFMPPEALVPNPVYSFPVDVFSFGGIALFVFSEEWPSPSAPKLRDPQTNKLVALSEAGRRQVFLNKIVGGNKVMIIKQLVERCLDDNPNMRPLIQEVKRIIEPLRADFMQMFNNLDMEKEITEMMGNPAAFQEMLQFLDGQSSNTKPSPRPTTTTSSTSTTSSSTSPSGTNTSPISSGLGMDAMMQRLSQNPQLMAQFMQNPMYQQLLQQMLSNPEMFQAVINHPMMANSPQTRANPSPSTTTTTSTSTTSSSNTSPSGTNASPTSSGLGMDAMMQQLSQNPQLMTQFMQNPMYQQLLQQMLSNPEMFQAVINHPMMANSPQTTATPSSSSATTTPSTSTTTSSNAPSSVTDASSASSGGMDAMMQHLSQNPQLMAQFMQTPMYQQLVQQMVTNPELFEVVANHPMMANSPQTRANVEETRSRLQDPKFRQAWTNPQAYQAAAQVYQGLQQLQDMGIDNSVPVSSSSGSVSPSSTNTTTANST
ncbi:ubiquilin-1-like isoform X2 [Dysidea avara]|uniref:ubiquilin-1-like isoform X2 n=1 Tax=Dysidea avara TaxID=196820 RepID=UPI0033262CCC